MKISLVQPNFRQGGQSFAGYWLPYSVACVYSYSAFGGQFDLELNQLTYSREPVDELCEKMQGDDLVLFSCYGWNWEYNKHLAKTLKVKSPGTHIIFGGANVSDWRTEEQFAEMDYVDTIIVNEGERAFKQFLADFEKGKPQRMYQMGGVRDLDIPSPYLHGVFERIIKEAPDVRWSAVLETNRGCPFSCTFCDWGGQGHAKVRKSPENRIKAELEWLGEHEVRYVMLADANFGLYAERDNRTADLLLDIQKRTGFPSTVNAQWFKNSRASVVALAKKFISNGLNRGMTLSVQSMDDNVLKAIKRKNMEMSHLKTMMDLLREHNIHNYTELILPLPLETAETWRKGLIEVLELGQHTSIETHMHQVFENAESNAPDHRDKYGIQTRILLDYLGGDSDIPENNEVVVATNTMSYAEFLDSWMYAWMIISFHLSGWSQILSRFAKQTGIMGYRNFYDNLYDHLQTSSGFLAEQYTHTRKTLDDYLNGRNRFSGSGFNLIWGGNRIFQKHRVEVFDELNKLFKPDSDLMRFQECYVTDVGMEYPFDATFSNDYWGIINEDGLDVYCKATYSFDVTFPWATNEQYEDWLYFRRRQGFGKCVINLQDHK